MEKVKFLSVICPDTKTSYGILSQLISHCDLNQHKFFVTANEDCRERFPKLYEFENLIFLPKTKNPLKKFVFFYKLLNSADFIIFHSLYFTSAKYRWFYFLFKKFLKKGVWVEWGADLYLWKNPSVSFKAKIKNYMDKVIRESFKYVAFTFPGNDVEFSKQFRPKSKMFYTPMPNPMSSLTGLMDYIDALNPEKQKHKKIVHKSQVSITPNGDILCNSNYGLEENMLQKKTEYRIQVAHNSFSFNHHVKLLNYLYEFEDENIELHLPMTYGVYGINGAFGGSQYVKCVEKYGKKLFAKKLTVITKNIPFEQYVKYLWTVDIAVFDFDRPCGLGNIRILLYMGKKIFLPSNSEFYKFLKDQGLAIYDTNEIPNMTFEEFVKPPKQSDLSWIKDYLNNDSSMAKWQAMFDELEKEGEKS